MIESVSVQKPIASNWAWCVIAAGEQQAIMNGGCGVSRAAAGSPNCEASPRVQDAGKEARSKGSLPRGGTRTAKSSVCATALGKKSASPCLGREDENCNTAVVPQFAIMQDSCNALNR